MVNVFILHIARWTFNWGMLTLFTTRARAQARCKERTRDRTRTIQGRRGSQMSCIRSLFGYVKFVPTQYTCREPDQFT